MPFESDEQRRAFFGKFGDSPKASRLRAQNDLGSRIARIRRQLDAARIDQANMPRERKTDEELTAWNKTSSKVSRLRRELDSLRIVYSQTKK